MRKLKKSYFQSLQLNVQKDLRIAYIESMLEKFGVDFPTEQSEPFECYRKFFQPAELAKLRSVDDKSDQTFVRICLTYIYKDNIEILNERSVAGSPARMVKKKNGSVSYLPAKEAITPKKYILLANIFAERIDWMDIDTCEKETRKKNLNRLVGKAIANIRNK